MKKIYSKAFALLFYGQKNKIKIKNTKKIKKETKENQKYSEERKNPSENIKYN